MPKNLSTTGTMSVCFSRINAAYAVSDTAEGGSVIKDVVIVQVGEAEGHYVSINQDFINDTVRLGNAADVVKCRVGHPKVAGWYSEGDGGGPALLAFLGVFQNFRVVGDKAVADLHVAPYAKEREFILSHAAAHPNMFGNSIVFDYQIFYTKQNGERTDSYEYAENNIIKDSIRTIKIMALKASDLVDEPAATDGLFSVTYHGEPPLQSTKKVKPVVMKIELSAKAKAAQKKAGKYFATITATTDEGTEVTITAKDDAPAVGDTVADADGNALTGTLIINGGDLDGVTIVVDDTGTITEYTPVDTAMEEDTPTSDPAEVNTTEGLSAKVDRLANSVEKIKAMLAKGPVHTPDERKADAGKQQKGADDKYSYAALAKQ